ncbi:MAG TPA: MbcA/ParS/Xre antitoxin family protein [Bryobacteraceae bacterium]|nr:MbcA/ParS/Xre antitoxin family protein [Bryobacteraceae bacterium]
MLTAEDREEIKQLVGAMTATVMPEATAALPLESDPVVARSIEVFGSREKALLWLRTPVRSLGDQAPITLLRDSVGVARVLDTLGQIEHGVW